jgi:UDP-N-acetylmuramate-alanine ligase
MGQKWARKCTQKLLRKMTQNVQKKFLRKMENFSRTVDQNLRDGAFLGVFSQGNVGAALEIW